LRTRVPKRRLERPSELSMAAWRGRWDRLPRRIFPPRAKRIIWYHTLTRKPSQVFCWKSSRSATGAMSWGCGPDWQDIGCQRISRGVAAQTVAQRYSARLRDVALCAGLPPLRGSLFTLAALTQCGGAVCLWTATRRPGSSKWAIPPIWKKETGYNIEFRPEQLAGLIPYDLSVYRNQISDFIYMADAARSGWRRREFEYRQRDAVLHGVEGVIVWQAHWRSEGSLFFGDRVRAKLKANRQSAPHSCEPVGVRFDQTAKCGSFRQVGSLPVKGPEPHRRWRDPRTSGYTMLALVWATRVRWRGTGLPAVCPRQITCWTR